MEKLNIIHNKSNTNKIEKEDYFLVNFNGESILTKIQHFKKWYKVISFVNWIRTDDYISEQTIYKQWHPIQKEQAISIIKNNENIEKTKHHIESELDIILSEENAEKEFLEILNKRPQLNKNLILKALTISKKYHSGQKRNEWSNYIIHPIRVATYAMIDFMDTECVISALLHDTLEDTNISENEIEENFWPKVLHLTMLLTKNNKELWDYYSSIANDNNAVIIKWYDRLNNIYSLFLDSDTSRTNNYITRTEKEVLPLLEWQESYENIKNIINILKTDKTIKHKYQEKLATLHRIQEMEENL
jgi:GTP pyrophosphokinase